MRRPPDRRWPLVLGYVVFLGLVALATTPVYLLVESRWQPLVVRLAAALVLGVALIHVHRIVARRVERDAVSAFNGALEPPSVPARLDRRLGELQSEVRAAVQSRRSFEQTLWPHLRALGAVSPPPSRRFGRGPSVKTLRAVVDTLHHQP